MSTIPKSILKDLPLKLQDSSVKNRVELLQTIKDALSKDEKTSGEDTVPSELAAKSLAKVLPLVFPRYFDGKSRHAVICLVQVILDKHFDASFKVFSASLLDYFSSWKEIVPSLYLVKIALFGLQWTSMIIAKASEKE